jgi:peptide-methionine (S)-S-oxide reductase
MKTRFLAAVAAASLLLSAAAPAAAALKTAVVAGGCFWSIEKAMEALPGVTSAVSGYSGGAGTNPTYRSHPGHLEAVRVTYDPAKVSYEKLLNHFFRNTDPTDPRGVICDYGPAYRTAVFVADDNERKVAEAVKAQVARTLGAEVATAIRGPAPFYEAEGYHQDYAKKNPYDYADYVRRCQRVEGMKRVWGGR